MAEVVVQRGHVASRPEPNAAVGLLKAALSYISKKTYYA